MYRGNMLRFSLFSHLITIDVLSYTQKDNENEGRIKCSERESGIPEQKACRADGGRA